MMKKRLFLLVMMVSATLVLVAANKTFTLVIDAGHGGRDTGACGARSQEKNLTLKYALAFGEMVEKNCPDVKVVYTRKTDVFLELWQRAEIANKQKADLFISVHINSLPKGHVARGFQTYTLGVGRVSRSGRGIVENLEVAKRENSVILIEDDYQQHYEGFDPNSPESNIMFEFIQDKNMEKSVELAKYMQRRVCAATGRQDMGAHQDNLAVLRLTSMPACLIELGFISTSDEEAFLNSDDAKGRYARGIYQAFLDYRKKFGASATASATADRKQSQKQSGKQAAGKQEQQQGSKSSGDKQEQKQSTKQEQKQGAKQEGKKQGGKSKAAQELADAREGRSSAPAKPQQANTDSVTSAAPAAPASKAPQASKAPTGSAAVDDAPVFKVQILTSGRELAANDQQLKGQKADYYQESGLYKYTVGTSTDYSEIYQLRKSLLTHFPQAFIIAFKNDSKMDVQAAIREYKEQKGKK